MTHEEKKKRIEESRVYGLYHQNQLIYVGQTTRVFSERLRKHIYDAVNRGGTSRLYTYLREEVEEPRRKNIEIEELDYDSEGNAIEDHVDILNEFDSHKAHVYRGHDWTRPQIRTLENAESMHEAYQQLDGITWPEVRRAGIKLGIFEEGEPKKYSTARQLTTLQVIAICVSYFFSSALQRDLAERYDVAPSVISKVVNAKIYNDIPRPQEIICKHEPASTSSFSVIGRMRLQ